MRAIVTGAAGFIGSTLVDRLLADGHVVIGIDNLSTGKVSNLEEALKGKSGRSGRFTLAQMDIQSPELSAVVAGVEPDAVFHLAAQVDVRVSVANPELDAFSNVLGTINVCEASRKAGVRRIVYAASGGSRYGAPANLPVSENAALAPRSPYAVAKLAGELYLDAYAGMYSIAPICLALANVYGPRQDPNGEAGVIALFGSGLIQGKTVTIYGDGTAARDFVFVDDVVDAFMRAAQAPLSVVGTYNIGTGCQTSVTEVHRAISAALGRTVPPRYAPSRVGELQAISLDAGNARRELGWNPLVDFDEGIHRTLTWLQDDLANSAHRTTTLTGVS